MAQHTLMMAQQIPPVFDLTASTMMHSSTTTGQIVTLTKSVHYQNT
jgi:hypothetical protein